MQTRNTIDTNNVHKLLADMRQQLKYLEEQQKMTLGAVQVLEHLLEQTEKEEENDNDSR